MKFKFLKKIISVISAAVLISAGLSSCTSVTRLEKLALVSAIGIDKGDEMKYKVTLQVFQSMGAGASTPVDASQSNAMIVEAESDTIAQAMEKAKLNLGRTLSMGHSRYIVLGSDILEQPLDEVLAYFVHSEQTYLGTPVISSQTTAKDILSVQLKFEVETAMAVSDIITTAEENGAAPDVDLLTAANAIYYDKSALALPVVNVKKAEEKSSDSSSSDSSSSDSESSQSSESSKSESSESSGSESEIQQPEIIFSGMKVVKDGKVIMELDTAYTLAVCWLEGTLKTAPVTLDYDGKPLGASVSLTSRKATIEANSGSYTALYKISAKIKLLDEVGISADGDKVCKIAEKALEKACEEAYNKISSDKNADFLGIERMTKSKFPRESIDNDSIFLSCGVDVNFTCHIDE